MSYILDALKKSEAERSRGVVPTLLAPQQTPLRSGITGWVIGGALLLNAAVLAAWFYWPAAQKSSPPSVSASAQPPPASSTAPLPAATAPAVAAIPGPSPVEPAAPQINPNDDAAAATTSVPTQMPPVVSGSTAAVDEAPAPRYEFSTHVYASDPSMRAVTLNGKRYTEGDTIDTGVRIKEITETGVILDIDGRSVPVDVLQEWR